MKRYFISTVFFALACSMYSCNPNNVTTGISENIPDSTIIKSSLLTKSQQEKLDPENVIDGLKKGNREYLNDRFTVRNDSKGVRDTVSMGQHPLAAVLTCVDSRVPVEDLFHKGIGDLFIVRVAGNIVNEDILGSLEYACKVSGSKVIVVVGHESCGAIESAIEDVKLGNITALLAKVQPAVQGAKADFKGDASGKNEEFVEAVCHKNVLLSIENIRKQSPILNEMEQKGQIKIIGAIYHIKSGVVDFL